jgi:hypothetical protein
MQYLLRNKIGLAILCLCISSAALAQRDEVFRPNHDELPFYFGLSFGFANHFSSYNLDENFLFANNLVQDPKSIIKISPINTTFFNLGLVGIKKIANNTYIRVNPNYIFGNKSFNFNINATKDSSQTFTTQPSIIQIPIALKIQSDRYNAFRYTNLMRHYIFVGGKFDIDLVSNKVGKISPPVSFTNSNYPSVFKAADVGVELGVGLSFYLRYATISPEIKFSYGLMNNKKNDILFSNIDRISSNFVFFTVHLNN